MEKYQTKDLNENRDDNILNHTLFEIEGDNLKILAPNQDREYFYNSRKDLLSAVYHIPTNLKKKKSLIKGNQIKLFLSEEDLTTLYNRIW
jgi:hypothetical protein